MNSVILRLCLASLLLAGSLLAQGSVLLVGGGSEDANDWSDVPYRWLVDHAPNKRVLVLHYSTTSTFLPPYFMSLGADTCISLAIATTVQANDSALYRTILGFDGIFLRGGDQWQYVNRWKGTLAEKAIREIFQRGGVVGGTSAGEAVLSSVIFDARSTSVDPRTALRDPLSSGITFTEQFLGFVPSSIADNHFYERGRLGRLPVMMSVHTQRSGMPVAGIGVDYNTALGIGPDGKGTVMGSGTVTLLRFGSSTITSAVASQPFSARNILFDQLTAGFSVDLKSGTISPSSSARSFTPSFATLNNGRFLLDGGSTVTDWSSPNAPLASLPSYLNIAADTILILTSPSKRQHGVSVESLLTLRGSLCRLLVHGVPESLHTAQAIQRAGAVVLAGLEPDSAAMLLGPATASGSALRAAVAAGRPLLALGNDLLMLSDTAVTKIELHRYGAYYGMMLRRSGTALLPGITVIPRVYEHADYIDNRMSAALWNLAHSGHRYALMVDAGSSFTMSNGNVRAAGRTPVMVIDASTAHTVAFPEWKDPGKSSPRQNAALLGARLHIIPPGDSLKLTSPLSIRPTGQRTGSPGGFELEQNYPNPFNPSTTFRIAVPEPSRVRITIFNTIGQECGSIGETEFGPGQHTVPFNGSHLSSGMYIARMEAIPLASGNIPVPRSITMVILQ